MYSHRGQKKVAFDAEDIFYFIDRIRAQKIKENMKTTSEKVKYFQSNAILSVLS